MEQQALSAGELRLLIFVIGVVILGLIYLYGRPKKPGQGKRKLFRKAGADNRVEPTLDGRVDPELGEADLQFGEQFDLIDSEHAAKPEVEIDRRPARPLVGVRPDTPIERIVTVFVSAREGTLIAGSDLVVAAEKAGLVFGDRGIFHRMQVGKNELGPIFSMANMLKPGNFDMTRIEALNTPGVTFFMALPGPLPALDAWDALLPTAQRLAELLDANLLDEKRGALGRQGISHIRDELRAWDRKQESGHFKPDW